MILILIRQKERGKKMVLLDVLVNEGNSKSLEQSDCFGKLNLKSTVSELPEWKFK